jgi:hypothetical protein
MPLLIDRSQRPAQIDDASLRVWAAAHAAFLSSEMRALQAERRAVADALSAIGMQVIMFEDLGGRDDDAETAYLDGVARSDVYVGLIGDRYGTMLPSGRSATHEEYREARRRGLAVAVWSATDETARQGDARDFLAEVRTFHTVGTWTDADRLPTSVVTRMRELAAEADSPWVKLGDLVFRADTIVDDGHTLQIEMSSRDQEMLAALEALRPDQWRSSSEVPVTTGNRCGRAQVTSVVSSASSTQRRQLTVRADVAWSDGRRSSFAAGINGVSAEDQVVAGLRAGLFGEALPGQLGMLAGMVDASDPLEALDALELPHATYEAVARLLIVERLLCQGGASHIEHIAIGPPHHGSRRIEVAWRDAVAYTNVEPARRSIEGVRNTTSTVPT